MESEYTLFHILENGEFICAEKEYLAVLTKANWLLDYSAFLLEIVFLANRCQ
jgi:hypothetical protein